MKQQARELKIIKIHIPMKFSVRGGRKTIFSEAAPAPRFVRTDNALLKAVALAHRWRAKIENGEYASITELAKAERVNDSYACRLLRLTLLAPRIVAEILDNRHPPEMTLKLMTRPFPLNWGEQFTER